MLDTTQEPTLEWTRYPYGPQANTPGVSEQRPFLTSHTYLGVTPEKEPFSHRWGRVQIVLVMRKRDQLTGHDVTEVSQWDVGGKGLLTAEKALTVQTFSEKQFHTLGRTNMLQIRTKWKFWG